MVNFTIPWCKPTIFGNEQDNVIDALKSTWISGGPYVQQFEERIASLLGVAHAIAVSNGTTALHAAVLALGIGPGDEVIVPGYTFVAPANMVLAVGARPVFVEVDPETFMISAEAVAAAVTPRTKAVIAVHLYGNVADMGAICAVAQAHGIPVLEDAAEAAFSKWGGKAAGTIGTIGTLSFQATKTIATGEGGMVLTNDGELARHLAVIRDHGMRKDKRYWHDVVGYNFRLTNVHAAIGCAQLDHLPEIVAGRHRVHDRYLSRIGGVPHVQPQAFRKDVDPLLWTMTCRLAADHLPDAELEQCRDAVMACLAADGIETRPGFYAMTSMPPYQGPHLPVARRTAASVIYLPTYLDLPDEQIDFIVQRLGEAVTSVVPSGAR